MSCILNPISMSKDSGGKNINKRKETKRKENKCIKCY